MRKFVWKNKIAITACTLTIAFSVGFWVLSQSPTETSIGDDLIVAGRVGIGTSTPEVELDINGQVKIAGGTPGIGKVLTSNATGVATWESPNESTYVESGQIAWSSSIMIFNHGLGAMPKRFGIYGQVVSAFNGFAVGDRINLITQDGDGGRHTAVWANTVSVRYRANSNSIFRAPDGSNQYISHAGLRLILWAEN